jgi:DNA-binding Lrp family transcriptional regulator
VSPPAEAPAPVARQTALDAVDRRIVGELVADSRCSIRDLATRVHVSRANAYARVARLRDDGVLRGFTTLVDPDACGVGLAALVLVTLDQGAWRTASERLDRVPGVVYRALTTGEFDCVLLVRVADVHMLRDVVLEDLRSIPEVRNTETIFVLEEAGVVASALPATVIAGSDERRA